VAVIIKGKQFEGWMNRRIDRYLSAVGGELHRLSQIAASKVNTGVRVRRKRGHGSYTKYPTPSRPGESPRMRRGIGKRNIVWGYDKQLQEARVGYTAEARYMTFHELAIRYRKKGYQQRPTILPTKRTYRQHLIAFGRRAAEGGR